MSAPISEVVSVTITAETSGVTRAGFGTALIAGYHTKYLDRVRTYSDLTDLVADGFETYNPVYLAASKLLSQNPSVATFKVGRCALAPTQKINLVPTDTTVGKVYSYSFVKASTGVASTATYTVIAADTVALIIDGLKIAIDALALGAATTDNTTSLDFTSSTAGLLFDFTDISTVPATTVSVTHVDPGIATDLAAINLADPDWYGLITTDNSKATVVAAAAWVQANKKVYGYDTIDTAVIASSVATDVIGTLQTASYTRSIGGFGYNLLSYMGAAMLGRDFPTDAGSATLAFKKLTGVSVPNLNTTARGFLDGKNGNYLSTMAGQNILRYGKVASGEYFDVIRLIDALEARIQEDVLTVFINNDKLPYSDLSVDVIKGTILAAIANFQPDGILLDPAPTVTAPLVATVSSVDKANRLLPDVKFTATIAGAIHKVTIAGKLVL